MIAMVDGLTTGMLARVVWLKGYLVEMTCTVEMLLFVLFMRCSLFLRYSTEVEAELRVDSVTPTRAE